VVRSFRSPAACPPGLDGIVHTGCIAANGLAVAVADELTSRSSPCSVNKVARIQDLNASVVLALKDVSRCQDTLLPVPRLESQTIGGTSSEPVSQAIFRGDLEAMIREHARERGIEVKEN
jgi:hypothetical protein